MIIYASLNLKPGYSNRQADSSTVLGPLGKAWIAEAGMGSRLVQTDGYRWQKAKTSHQISSKMTDVSVAST